MAAPAAVLQQLVAAVEAVETGSGALQQSQVAVQACWCLVAACHFRYLLLQVPPPSLQSPAEHRAAVELFSLGLASIFRKHLPPNIFRQHVFAKYQTGQQSLGQRKRVVL